MKVIRPAPLLRLLHLGLKIVIDVLEQLLDRLKYILRHANCRWYDKNVRQLRKQS